MRTITLALWLVLSTLSSIAGAQPAPAVPKPCIDPADYGAIPNDGVSDRVAMQRALDLADGGGTVCLGAGRFTCERAGPGAYSRTACLATHGKRITFRGTGPGTIIELRGDQALQQTIVFAIEPAAKDIQLEGIAFDTTGTYRTEEQTHVIATTSNRPSTAPPYDKIEGITLKDLRFVHPPPVAGERKGDCVRLGSNVPVIDVKIIGSTFDDCARSGIEMQRELREAKIIANTFRLKWGDQVIDGEATGGGWVYDVQIIGNTFEDGPMMQGDYSVSCTSCLRLIVSNNIFKSRGLILVRSIDAMIHHNIFDATMKYAGQAVVESANVADGLRIEDNNVYRHGLPGFAIRVQPHGQNGPPNDVRIRNNRMVVDGDSSGILVHSPDGLRVEDNDVTWTGPAPNGMGVLIQAGIRPATDVRVTNNGFYGTTYYAAVRLSATLGLFYAGLRVKDNDSRGGTRSLMCDSLLSSAYVDPVITGGNAWMVASNCASPSVPLAPGN